MVILPYIYLHFTIYRITFALPIAEHPTHRHLSKHQPLQRRQSTHC